MRHESKQKFDIRQRRAFSKELKKKAVKGLVGKWITVRRLMQEYQVATICVCAF
jgi:hypothetical protein